MFSLYYLFLVDSLLDSFEVIVPSDLCVHV